MDYQLREIEKDVDSEEYVMEIDLRKDVAYKATTSASQKDIM